MNKYFDILRIAQRQSNGRIGSWCPTHYFQSALAEAGRGRVGRMPHEVIVVQAPQNGSNK
jgi:hypothetical protein